MVATTTINMSSDAVKAEAEVTSQDGFRKKKSISHRMKRHQSEKNLKRKHCAHAPISPGTRRAPTNQPGKIVFKSGKFDWPGQCEP